MSDRKKLAVDMKPRQTGVRRQYAELYVFCPSAFHCRAPKAHFVPNHWSCDGGGGDLKSLRVCVCVGRQVALPGETAVSALPAITASQTFSRRREQSVWHPSQNHI